MKFTTIEEHIRAINSNPTASMTLDLMSFAAVGETWAREAKFLAD